MFVAHPSHPHGRCCLLRRDSAQLPRTVQHHLVQPHVWLHSLHDGCLHLRRTQLAKQHAASAVHRGQRRLLGPRHPHVLHAEPVPDLRLDLPSFLRANSAVLPVRPQLPAVLVRAPRPREQPVLQSLNPRDGGAGAALRGRHPNN